MSASASTAPSAPSSAPAFAGASTSSEPPTATLALAPGLQQLIHRGLLSRAQAEEVTAYAAEVHDAVTRGEMTLSQAETLGAMLGLRYQSRRRLQ